MRSLFPVEPRSDCEERVVKTNPLPRVAHARAPRTGTYPARPAVDAPLPLLLPPPPVVRAPQAPCRCVVRLVQAGCWAAFSAPIPTGPVRSASSACLALPPR
jgi:hypothetical protein